MDYNMVECSFLSISFQNGDTVLCLTLKFIFFLLNCAGCFFYPLQILAAILQIM